ncbi:MAG: hypothetical protein AMXMBFR19_18460 [Chthonomonadaceae bacterium]
MQNPQHEFPISGRIENEPIGKDADLERIVADLCFVWGCQEVPDLSFIERTEHDAVVFRDDPRAGQAFDLGFIDDGRIGVVSATKDHFAPRSLRDVHHLARLRARPTLVDVVFAQGHIPRLSKTRKLP